MTRSNQVRIQSAQILSNIGDLRAVEALVNALEKDPLKEMRAIAASAIGNMRARGKDLVIRSVEVLARSLNDKNDTIVINVSKALGQLNVQYDKADQKLIEIAQDKRRRETVLTYDKTNSKVYLSTLGKQCYASCLVMIPVLTCAEQLQKS